MSENYRALTRKHRPSSFNDIVSQEHVSNTLLNAIKQHRLSHAYMFCGPRGVGKTTMARVLAREINEIDAEIDGEALNLTLNIIEMDAASNNKVEDVHHLRESVRIPPQNGRYKVFIVDEVHMLSKAAFNALLKTLEEPPEHAIFIFATTEPHKVLPTILSRVQRFDFKRISVQEIVSRLKHIAVDEQIQIDEESLHVIAKKADGALRDALGLMDQAIAFCGATITHNELLQALNVVGTDRLFEFMECVAQKNADAGMQLINTLLQEGYDIQEFLIGLTEHLRNLYIAHHSSQMYLVEASEETKAKYLQTATDFSRDDLMRMLHIVSEAQIKLKDANQPRIQFEITLLKLIHMEKSEQLNTLLAEIDALKKNSSFLEKPESSTNSVVITASTHKDANTQNSLVHTSVLQNIAQESTQSKGNESVTETTSKSDPISDEFDLGSPALVTEVTHQANEIHGNNYSVNPIVEKKVESDVQVLEKKLLLEDVRAVWQEFLNSLSQRVPKILELQVQRVQPTLLKGLTLTLECDNPLAQQMLKEQEMDLTMILKEHLGVKVRFNPIVSQGSKTNTQAKNPYERFKEIQQKDPILRELVERFGAELEY
jgi:DNA polymerase-3 subunit gamma/tau